MGDGLILVNVGEFFDELASIYERQAAARDAIEAEHEDGAGGPVAAALGAMDSDPDDGLYGDCANGTCDCAEQLAAEWELNDARLGGEPAPYVPAGFQGIGSGLAPAVPDAELVPYLRAINSLLMHAGALEHIGATTSAAAIEQAARVLLEECSGLALRLRSVTWQRDDLEAQLKDAAREIESLRYDRDEAEHDVRELELELEQAEIERDELARELAGRDVPLMKFAGERLEINGAALVLWGDVTPAGLMQAIGTLMESRELAAA